MAHILNSRSSLLHMLAPDNIYARKLMREIQAREEAEALLEKKSLELYKQAQEREQAVAALRESEERFRLIVEMSPSSIIIEVDRKIVFTNTSARLLFLETATESLMGKSLLSLAAHRDRAIAESHLELAYSGGSHLETDEMAERLDGSLVPIAVRRAALIFQGKNAVQMVCRDISARKRLEEQLAHQATRDQLTGIFNRSQLIENLSQALSHASRYQYPIWVGFIDLDDFKPVNDNYGHLIGDQLLIQVANRINAVLRSGDAFGRFGGDEFIVVLRGGPNDNLNEILIERIMTAVSTPMIIDGHQLKVTCSFGLAVYPTHGGSADTLIDIADKAMYRAKQAGSNIWQFYSEHNSSQSP